MHRIRSAFWYIAAITVVYAMEGGSLALLWNLLVAGPFGVKHLTIVHALGLGTLLRLARIVHQNGLFGWPLPFTEISDYEDFKLCVGASAGFLARPTLMGVLVYIVMQA